MNRRAVKYSKEFAEYEAHDMVQRLGRDCRENLAKAFESYQKAKEIADSWEFEIYDFMAVLNEVMKKDEGS